MESIQNMLAARPKVESIHFEVCRLKRFAQRGLRALPSGRRTRLGCSVGVSKGASWASLYASRFSAPVSTGRWCSSTELPCVSPRCPRMAAGRHCGSGRHGCVSTGIRCGSWPMRCGSRRRRCGSRVRGCLSSGRHCGAGGGGCASDGRICGWTVLSGFVVWEFNAGSNGWPTSRTDWRKFFFPMLPLVLPASAGWRRVRHAGWQHPC